MKIVYLHQYFNTPAMPGSVRSFELAKRLVRAGHEVHVITAWREDDGRRGWSSTVEDGVEVHWYPVAYSNRMGFWRRIRAFVIFAWMAATRAVRTGADIVYATSTPLSIAIPGIVASRRLGVPMVFEVRDQWPDVPIALGVLRNPVLIALARRLESMAYRQASRIVALAPGMKEDIVAKGVPESKVTVIPNGCDLGAADGTPRVADPRALYEWLGAHKLVLYAGTVGRANGVDYLVKVAAAMRPLDPQIRFVVIGDGAEAGRVRAAADEAGVLGHSFFMLPPIAKGELSGWLRAADLHVALMRGPSSYTKDAVNNKFFDALAFGKPIANNFIGWQATLAEGAGIGVHLNPDDPDAGASAIERALADRDWLAQVPDRARELARERFDYSLLAARLEEVLRIA